MSAFVPALKAELLKLKHSGIVWMTFAAFALAPIMGGVFILIVRNPEAMAKAGTFSSKAQMMNFAADWPSYCSVLTQAIGVGGVLVFGFVASWIFGREYTEGTAKDLLSLPTGRTHILNAKFIVYAIWCVALAVSNLIAGLVIGAVLHLSLAETGWIMPQLTTYFIATLLTMLSGMPIAFFALWGKGYLAPLGFVALTLVFSQIIGATGYGYYFPWAVPGLYSGAGGTYKEQLNLLSYILLVLTAVAGYAATIGYWKYSDQQ